MPHTLEEIAALVGVSRSTVSRVINDQPNVDVETRARVWQVVREHDFHPNSAARTLARRRSQIIGLIIPQAFSAVFTDPYFPPLIQCISTACEERGYYLMLSFVSQRSDEAFGRLVRAGHLDGLIVATALNDDAFVSRLTAQHFPFVVIGRSPHPAEVTTVDADNVRGASMAAWHLARLGYTRIATITGPFTTTAALDRRDGFLNGLRDAGLSLHDHYLQEGDWTESGGRQAMLALLQLPARPQAVFVASDAMAIGALKAIRSAGLTVPDDVALVGFDDVPLASAVEPPLTTVRQPIDKLGFMAATVLLDQLEAGPEGKATAEGQHIVLPTELVIRESCGQARRFALGRR
jgi:LacI family transcriptional regulator